MVLVLRTIILHRRLQPLANPGRVPASHDLSHGVLLRYARPGSRCLNSYDVYCLTLYTVSSHHSLADVRRHSPAPGHPQILALMALASRSIYIPCSRHGRDGDAWPCHPVPTARVQCLSASPRSNLR